MTRPNTSDGQLRSFVERIERVNEEIGSLRGDRKDLFLEVKSAGFDVAAVRQIIKERAQDSAKAAEREAIVETYRAALGQLADSPLGNSAMGRA